MITLASRNDLGFLLHPGAVVAEIGVWRGYFSTEIMKWPAVKKAYFIDAWAKQHGYVDPLSDEDHEANFNEAKYNLLGHMASGRAEVIRGYSFETARDNRDIPPLDMAYIDGDHSYIACGSDLYNWCRRLKRDGLLCGHDYVTNEHTKKWGFGVVEAVDEFCSKYGWRMTHITAEEYPSYVLQRK